MAVSCGTRTVAAAQFAARELFIALEGADDDLRREVQDIFAALRCDDEAAKLRHKIEYAQFMRGSSDQVVAAEHDIHNILENVGTAILTLVEDLRRSA